MSRVYAYIGNWCLPSKITTDPKGISICSYDPETGGLEHLKTVCPEFFVGGAFLDQKRGVLYVTDERANLPGMRQGGGGQIAAFAISPETGDLTELCRTPSYGANPAYLVSDGGDYLLVANHGTRTNVTFTETAPDGSIQIKTMFDESSIVLFPLREDGSFDKPCDIFRLSGEGPDIFQLGPHAHCVEKAPLDNLYAVCDKGGDQVFMLKIDYENRRIVPCDGGPYHRCPGSAPRHCVFHPTLPYLYLNKEYKTVISGFQYDQEGKLEHVCTTDALPPHIAPPVGASQSGICIDKTGKYIYDLMRQVNTISVFEVDAQTGQLSLVQSLENACVEPRFGAISPDGKFLLVAAFGGLEILSYPITSDGRLLPAVASSPQPMPGTISFYEVE